MFTRLQVASISIVLLIPIAYYIHWTINAENKQFAEIFGCKRPWKTIDMSSCSPSVVKKLAELRREYETRKLVLNSSPSITEITSQGDSLLSPTDISSKPPELKQAIDMARQRLQEAIYCAREASYEVADINE